MLVKYTRCIKVGFGVKRLWVSLRKKEPITFLHLMYLYDIYEK